MKDEGPVPLKRGWRCTVAVDLDAHSRARVIAVPYNDPYDAYGLFFILGREQDLYTGSYGHSGRITGDEESTWACIQGFCGPVKPRTSCNDHDGNNHASTP